MKKLMIFFIFLLMTTTVLAGNKTDEYCNRFNFSTSDCTLLQDMTKELIQENPQAVNTTIVNNITHYVMDNVTNISNYYNYTDRTWVTNYIKKKNYTNFSEVFTRYEINNKLKSYPTNSTVNNLFAKKSEIPTQKDLDFDEDDVDDMLDDFMDDSVEPYVKSQKGSNSIAYFSLFLNILTIGYLAYLLMGNKGKESEI